MESQNHRPLLDHLPFLVFPKTCYLYHLRTKLRGTNTQTADVSSWELEITSSIPASKVFDGFVLRFFEFVIKNFIPESFGTKLTTFEGDGGVGTIMLMTSDNFASVKYKVKERDLENFTYIFAVIKETSGNEYESNISEMKVIQYADGGCTFKQKNTHFDVIDEGEIETEKEQIAGYFWGFEATLDRDFGDL